MRLARGVSGVVAAGTVLLMGVVLGAAWLGERRGFPGPGSESITAHIIIAVIVIVAQIYSDRRRGGLALAGSTAVVGAAFWLLWTQWWG